ncbi:MAG: hypothetical protein L0Z62_49915 [Gemmataceae bacterium]|nr:hypothetical protein [Gemmataceae bacterium]
MAERPSDRPHMAPFQEFALEPVTDPAEQAALDRKLRESGEGGVIRAGGVAAPRKATLSKVQELCRQLPAQARLKLITRLAAELSSDGQRKLVKQLLSQLPPDAFQQQEEHRRRRSGGR